MYQNIRQPGGSTGANTVSPTGLMVGTGVRIVATEKNHEQGNMIQTNNALDISILGEGMFQILQNDGTIAYTRDGSFKLSPERNLVTASGELLQPQITIPQDAESVSIGVDGTVTVQPTGNAQEITIGQIQISRFLNYAGLEPKGRNLYSETTASGAPIVVNPSEQGAGSLQQGSLEGSNVNVVEEMVAMIETQRAYEINSKAISSVDSMLRFLNQNL
jgi:flagellar basal-body rod protein FlgG